MFHTKFDNDERFSHSVSRQAMKAKVIQSVRASRVLLLSPHPDDDVLGCGGLLAHLSKEGAKIRVVYFDDGARGSESGKRDPDLIWQREEEAIKALRLIDVSEVKFLRLKNLPAQKDLWKAVFKELKTRPNDLVLLPSEHDWHPDHSALAKASYFAYQKLKSPKLKLWSYFVWGVSELNLIFPIDKYLKTKKEAILCHKSQLKVKPYDEAIFSMNRYVGEALGVAKYAEGYYENKPN